MGRKTFRDRILRLEEAAWIINNEVKEIKQLYSEIEEENTQLKQQLQTLRLQLQSTRRNSNSFAHV